MEGLNGKKLFCPISISIRNKRPSEKLSTEASQKEGFRLRSK